jgi:uncharacterized membrane protein (UPF0127 family)
MNDKIKIGETEFSTLVAVTEEDHTNGLMFKAWPPPIMSFPYSTAEVRKFWMHNTISPLDIIFCKANKIVDICYGKPLSLDFIGPDFPIDLVVELPLGTSKKHGLSVGDAVQLKCSVNTIAKEFLFKYSKIID